MFYVSNEKIYVWQEYFINLSPSGRPISVISFHIKVIHILDIRKISNF